LIVGQPRGRRLAGVLLAPLLFLSCHLDQPTPDLLVYAVNRNSVTATVRVDGAATSDVPVPPCGLYRQPFLGTDDHELLIATPSGSRFTFVHTVVGAHTTSWYVITPEGELVESTQPEVNAVLAACRASGMSPSP
jgi:hypothetical protein